jgi:hypothetical protein
VYGTKNKTGESFMNNTIQNQMVGTEYSEIYRNLHKEVSEQNAKTAQIPSVQTLADYIGKMSNDSVHLGVGNLSIKKIEKVGEENVERTFATLINTIKEYPSSAYESQNHLLANRIAALLKS